MFVGKARAGTLCGVAALLVWSTATALMRSCSEYFGPIGSAALIYSFGTLLLLVLPGQGSLHRASRSYLLAGGLLFVTYEVCLSLALGYAHSRSQSIQVGLVNSLWPCLTVLFSILINRQRVRWFVFPGTLLALLRTVRVVSTEGLSLASFLDNLASNPLSYGLALTCAVTFALYCNITTRYARGENHVALFFALTALVLWLKYALSEESLPGFAPRPTLELAALVLAMAGGYALWNLAILRGNLTLLATLSYFTPVLAAGFSAFWLSASLTLQFWQGVVLVTLGSLVCWYGTRSNVAPAQALDGRPGDGAGQPVRS